MSLDLGSLSGEIDLDVSPFDRALDRSQRKLREWGSKSAGDAEKSGKSIGDNMGKGMLRSSLSTAGGIQISKMLDRTRASATGLLTITNGLDGAARKGTLLAGALVAATAAAAPLAAVAVGGALALGPVLAAGAAGAGVAALAFRGVGDALGALDKARQSAAAGAAAQAAKEASAAAGVKSAVQGVADARRSAADSAVSAAQRVQDARSAVAEAEQSAADSAVSAAQRVQDARSAVAEAEQSAADSAVSAAQRVQDARQSYADAEQSAADSIRSALDSQRRAEDDLTSAQEDSRQAQLALTAAREDARRSLQDMNFDVREGALREKEAQLQLGDARTKLAKTNADPKASQADRARALIDYQQQQLALEELGVRNKRLQSDATAANKAGVNGSQQVRDAQDNIADAQQRVVDAQKAAGAAAQAVARTRVDAARNIQRAEEGVSEALSDQGRTATDNAARISAAQEDVSQALSDQARTRVDAARNIQRAEEGVSEALSDQGRTATDNAARISAAQGQLRTAQTAYGDALKGTSGGQDELNAALAAAGPAGAAFAIFLDGLRGKMGALRDAAQSGFLPGLTDGIRSALPILPALERMLAAVSDELGVGARALGAFIGGPEGKAFIDFLAKTSPPLLRQFLAISGNIGKGLLDIMPAVMPLTTMVMGFLERMSAEFEAFGSGSGIDAFVAYILANTPLLSALFGNVLDVVTGLVKAALPLSGPVLAAVSALAGALADLVGGADFAGFVANVGGIATALMPAFGPLAQVIGSIVRVLSGQLLAIMPTLIPVVLQFAQAFGQVVVGLSPLLPALITLAGVLLQVILPALYPIIFAFRTALVPVILSLTQTVTALTPFLLQLAGSFLQLAPMVARVLLQVLPLAAVLLTQLIPALSAVIGWVTQNQTAVAVLAGGIGALLLVMQIHAAFMAVQAAGGLASYLKSTRLITGATKAWAAVQWLMNAALTANPIGLVIAGIALLVAGLVWFFTQTEVGQRIVRAAMSGIRTAIGWVVDKAKELWGWVSSNWPAIQSILTTPMRLAWAAISGTWGFISGAFRSAVTFVKSVFSLGWATLKRILTDPIGSGKAAIATLLGATGLQRVFSGAVSFVKSVFSLGWATLKRILTDPIGSGKAAIATLLGATGLQRVFSGAVSFVKGVFSLGWATLKKILTDPIGAAKTAIALLLGATGLQRVFSDAVTAVGRIWDGIKEKTKAPIRFVVDTVLNQGLIGGFNTIAGAISDDLKLPTITLPKGFHDGGYTGDMDPRKIAGVVHGDEEVIRSSSRRKFEQKFPGYLHHINATGNMPGYFDGGVVGGSGRFSSLFMSRLLLASKMANQTINAFQRGYRPSTSYSGTSHQGDAIDLQVSPSLIAALRSVGIPTWDRTGKGNWAPHAHGVPLPGSGYAAGSAVWQAQDYLRGGDGLGGRDNGPRGGVLSKIAAGAGKVVDAVSGGITDPSGFLGGLATKALGGLAKFGSNPLIKILGGLPGRLVGGMADKITNGLGMGYAGGTTFAQPGLHPIAEDGFELVTSPQLRRFSGGEQVHANGATRDFLANMGGTSLSDDDIARLADALRDAVLDGTSHLRPATARDKGAWVSDGDHYNQARGGRRR